MSPTGDKNAPPNRIAQAYYPLPQKSGQQKPRKYSIVYRQTSGHRYSGERH
jgi:hypothetical protein